MIKAVIFDMDGVLIDAKEWHYEALNLALSLYGYNISREDHLSIYDGLPTRKKLEMLTREHGLPASLHSVINELKQEYTLKLAQAHCTPRNDHQFALERLQASGFSLGVASNSIKNSITVMLETAKILRYFDVILSNEDVKRPKPDPEIYLTSAARLGAKPWECLVVEDHPYGIEAAHAAGTHTMTVSSVADVNWENIEKNLFAASSEIRTGKRRKKVA
jgi:beta-phosphoglucomutase